MPKYQATDSRGKVWTRNTKGSGRTYSHAVVHYRAADPTRADEWKRGEYSKAEWRRTLELARQVRAYHDCTVEIIEAIEQ